MNFDPMWDTRFAESDYAYGTEPNDFLKAQVKQLKGKRVLSLAEGEGRNAVYLAKLGFNVTAVDASIKGIEKAQQLAQASGVSINFIQADLASFDLGREQWDNIIAIFAPFGQGLRAKLHQRVVQALVPGGVFLTEAYSPEQIQFGTGGGKDVDTMLTAAQLAQELRGVKWTLLEQLERSVVEGRYHTGMAAVVQGVGVKPNF
ncbi:MULTISPECIES: class I SAM-dependent methyltransferase [unclassified Pseudoalteromonas]|uniref:class I SAM-dependent methyltransferase n=1 Tax=unclassified Pseudoalteromonas TaxID=194690 RepID=UPI002096EE16|nr:class I SAM-dependent methyltransferase [Pseudoalteromonas sp. XMcav2-N]MCO7187023.1 class I SAM-dependent methyltransferase [Pseudoalteromonas sp. XMcav2-N]